MQTDERASGELSTDELEAEAAADLPNREAMSLLDPNVLGGAIVSGPQPPQQADFDQLTSQSPQTGTVESPMPPPSETPAQPSPEPIGGPAAEPEPIAVPAPAPESEPYQPSVTAYDQTA